MAEDDPVAKKLEDRMRSRDIRDSMFTLIRRFNPSTEAAMAGLLNTLGAVIAEKSKDNPAERHRLMGLVNTFLSRYVEAYTRGPNPFN